MLDTTNHDGIVELRMARPPVNALNPELVHALRFAIEGAPGQGARGIVLAGGQGIFSAGLDIPTLLTLDRSQMAAFWADFFGLCGALARSPIPVVAAIAGHSPAGGAVLAIFCDYRVMARGDYRIGLNEVQVGLVVPENIQQALRRLVGRYRAERLLVAGAMLDPDQALTVGMVDELAELNDVNARAHAWLEGLLALPSQAMRRTRDLSRADLVASFAAPQDLPVQDFLDVWFSGEAQTTLRALVAKLKSKHQG